MPQKTKLVIVIPTLECGGAENFVSQLCNFVNKNEFDVTLLVIDNRNPFYTINENVKVIDLKAKRALTSMPTILREIKNIQPQVLISVANHLNLLFAIFRKWLPKNTKLIAWETSIVSNNAPNVKSPAFYNWLMKTFYKKLPTIVCQSTHMQQDLIAYYNCRAAQLPVIATGAAIPDYQTNEQVSIPSIFLTVARLSQEKGIADIIKMLSQFQQPFIYHIVGEGDIKNDLQQVVDDLKMNDKVVFHGRKQKPFSGFEQANVFLMASYFEGLPTTLMEATSYGIPVVTFAAPGGISEIITHGLNGFIVPERSTEAFLAALTVALQHPFNRKTIRQNTIDKFDNQRSLQQLQDLFSNLAAQ